MVKETEYLSNTVGRFWSLKSYGTYQKDDASVLPLQEQKALETLKNTIHFVENYLVLDYYENKINQPYTKSLTLSMFHPLYDSLEKKFI